MKIVFSKIKDMLSIIHIAISLKWQIQFKYNSYFAVSISSFSSGTSLWTRIPLFILAGSKAQFDIPINATYFENITLLRYWSHFSILEEYSSTLKETNVTLQYNRKTHFSNFKNKNPNQIVNKGINGTFLCSSNSSLSRHPSSNKGCNAWKIIHHCLSTYILCFKILKHLKRHLKCRQFESITKMNLSFCYTCMSIFF